MSADSQAVSDDRLRVHGIAGLRVADVSIMPTITSGNTNVPAIMSGEKAAEMTLEDAQGTAQTTVEVPELRQAGGQAR